ncbi:MAG: GreA/GreB family elongation factor [Terriglobales bacterium]
MPVRIKEKLEREIQLLDHELNVELPAELKRAVALGDLSENAEYHMAKQRQEFVMARLGQLKKRLADLSMVNLNNIPHDKVGYGSIVGLLNLDTDEPVEYHLVSSEEADATRGFISTSSPIGRGLLGKEVGEAVHIQTPGGAKEFEVRKLVTIHEREDEF